MKLLEKRPNGAVSTEKNAAGRHSEQKQKTDKKESLTTPSSEVKGKRRFSSVHPRFHPVTILNPRLRGGTCDGFFEMIADNADGVQVLCLLTVTDAFKGPKTSRKNLRREDLPF